MKNNVMMRIASILLVAVLISTSAISGTYAKYTTQDAGRDEARVAKWGVELQVFGNLYGDTYRDNIVKEAEDTGDNIRVQSVDKAADVVAPGTKNTEGFSITLKGQPEVDGIITSKMTIQNIFLDAGEYGIMVRVPGGVITAENSDEWDEKLYKKDGNSFVETEYDAAVTEYYTLEDYVKLEHKYFPVVYKLAGSTSYVSSDKYQEDSLEIIAEKLAAQLNMTVEATNADHSVNYSGSRTFKANENLTETVKVDDLKLTWVWEYDWDKCDKNGDNADMLCKADTILGNLQEGNLYVVKLNDTTYERVDAKFYCLKTQFSIDITVTQVD